MCISDETFDLIREAWARGIPPQYRFREKFRPSSSSTSDRFLSPAIILPVPPAATLERWLAMVCAPHLTEEQRQEEARREAMKKHGPSPRQRDYWNARNRRRAELKRIAKDTFEAAREGV